MATLRLIEIEEYIAEDAPQAAEAFVDKLVASAAKLDKQAHRGRPLPELPGSPYRELLVGDYRIVNRVSGSTVDILTVFEGHRLLRLDEL